MAYITKCIFELVGTFILLLIGDGVVACSSLNRSKGQNGGWIVITIGWGLAVMCGVFVAGPYSGAHLNPAVTLGFALAGSFPWAEVPGYVISQVAGGFLGALTVYLFYKDHFDLTDDADVKLSIFCTMPAVSNRSRNFFCEAVASFLLVFIILALTTKENVPAIGMGDLGAFPVSMLIMAIGMSLGGTTGYAINPARDFGPRCVHALMPIKGKRDSGWSYSWIPVAAPFAGAAIAAGLFLLMYSPQTDPAPVPEAVTPVENVWAVTDIAVLDHKEITDLAGETGTQTLMGTPMKVEAAKDDWLKVETPEGYHAWVKDLAVVQMDDAQFDSWRGSPKLIITANYTLLREAASKTSAQLRDAVAGCLIGYRGVEEDYYEGYLPDGTTVFVPKSDAMDFGQWLDLRDPSQENIVATAEQLSGIPYVWGGTSVKGMDCSGFTKMVFFLNGLILRRNASQQQVDGETLATDGDWSPLQPGDLVFFGRKATSEKPAKASHVGIYLGNSHFIHASSFIRVSSLDPEDDDYYPNAVNFIGAGRVLGNEDCDRGIVSIKKHEWYFKQN